MQFTPCVQIMFKSQSFLCPIEFEQFLKTLIAVALSYLTIQLLFLRSLGGIWAISQRILASFDSDITSWHALMLGMFISWCGLVAGLLLLLLLLLVLWVLFDFDGLELLFELVDLGQALAYFQWVSPVIQNRFEYHFRLLPDSFEIRNSVN